MIDKNAGSTHPLLDAETADKLLGRLSTDDEFRAQFQSDPTGALSSVGHPEATAALAGVSCMRVETLAPKEEIQASRDVLKQYLTSTGSHTVVYSFEAGRVASSLRRK